MTQPSVILDDWLIVPLTDTEHEGGGWVVRQLVWGMLVRGAGDARSWECGCDA